MTEEYDKNVFIKTSIADIISKDPLIAVPNTATVEELLKVLHKHSLTSCPVVNPDTGRNRVIGFVDTNDVLALLAKLTKNVDRQTSDLRLISIGFLSSSVANIMDLSKKDQFTVVLEEQSMFEVMKVYAKGVHRVALLSVFSDIDDIVSQSCVVSFIASNVSVLGSLANKKIEDLLDHLVHQSELVTTSSSELVIRSFQKMNDAGVTAVPVLDHENGSIVGTLSINDLSSINEENIDLLLQSTEKFISRNVFIDQNKHKPAYPIILGVKDTFKDAIEMLAKFKIHRVWIVDRNRKPISILSLTDVCKILTEPPTELAS
ncbi:hypothetical protein PPL_00992 [Heterostelium album PN500]|uniref:CBS domain-containing protein n=1 Tax=Heterostelium pallidum (strain ATCC 26659 / Pp 5 / PN500) TaxID=670386 RepID=D3AXT5_HETP5|nr:hypothetical protein PPL_00992 [Heterostelium album PN500]EFA85762.1 hypothetical protein PPL_00992 [Heterostelium album PN500]|eukprot:XP_020437868.1 hypothetical protein PPL_00992 [Heterostelium album PN500]